MEDDFGAVDAIARRFADRGGQPGLAYGVVTRGALAHAAGLGQQRLGGPVPGADTVFRIASMTKSFTASVVLLLRDAAALRLDDQAQDYVGELRELQLPSADSPRPTIRQLLTMTAGFPADDPWGDRQQGLDDAGFSELLHGGARFAWAPGTRFEYSNLGYAILGRVIKAAAGQDYADVVRGRMLGPLGMSDTGYDAHEFDDGRLARGHRPDGSGGWEEVIPDGDGAFAPMGGIFSCVSDLARWVSGFTDGFPPRDGEKGTHPLSRATRREMQLAQTMIANRPAGWFPAATPAGYGYGLFVEEDPEFGAIIQHSGGYPGFGSNMRWHPATGTGVIVLANSTYAAAGALSTQLLSALLRPAPASQARSAGAGDSGAGDSGAGDSGAGNDGPGDDGTGDSGPAGAVRGPAPGDGRPWPETLTARAAIDELLQAWADTSAARLFSANVAWDQPFASRRDALDRIRQRIGDFRPDPGRPAEYDSPAHCRWWLLGAQGTVQAEIRLTPQRDPRVQELSVAVPPAPGSALQAALDSLLSLINSGGEPWPGSLQLAASVDAGGLARQLRLASVSAGQVAVSAFQAGDGAESVTAELAGDNARVIVTVVVDRAGAILQADVTAAPHA